MINILLGISKPFNGKTIFLYEISKKNYKVSIVHDIIREVGNSCPLFAWLMEILFTPRGAQVYKYILRRILMMIPVLLGVVFIVFTLMYITPGDPASIMLGESATPEAVEHLRDELGLNKSFIVQFFNYVKGVALDGNLGISYVTKRSVSTEILERFPTTALLALLSAVVSLGIGIFAGIISATRQYTFLDSFITALSLVGVSMPNFWQALVSIMIFSLWLGILPASGTYGWQYWILPSATLGTAAAAIIMRMTRSSMLEVIRQDYIRTARAKGQSEFKVIMKHAFRNALIPVITVAGLQFGHLLGGSVLIESIYAIPGLGKYMVDAIRQRDSPVVQGGVLFMALVFSCMNLLIDLIYTFVDPRIKTQFKRSKKTNQGARKEVKA
jgi:peptide/nickel transport system permease protein